MSSHPAPEHGSGHRHGIVHYLEGGDGIAHVIVALFLLLLALCIIGYGTYSFVSDLSGGLKPAVSQEQAGAALEQRTVSTTERTERTHEDIQPVEPAGAAPRTTTSDSEKSVVQSEPKKDEPEPFAERFGQVALVFLSDLLFGVVVLELLSTILTYIQARNLEATIKDFLVVALISSIRKILLIGAQSSLEKSTASEFTMEATGTVVSILGILLLIAGLLALDKRAKAKALESAEAAAAMTVTADLEEQPI